MANFNDNGDMILSLDVEQSINNINGQLSDVQSKLNDLKVSAKIKDTDIENLQKQINGIGKNVNLGLTGQNIINQAKQAGKLVSDELNNAMKNISSKEISSPFKVNMTNSLEFKRQIESFVSELTNAKGIMKDFSVSTKTVFDSNTNKNIEEVTGALVKYENELGQVITKTLSYGKIGEYKNPISGVMEEVKGFVEVSGKYSSSIDSMQKKTQTFNDQVTKSTSSLTNQLNEYYKKVTDVNASKPIKDDVNLSNLKSQYDTTINSINALNTASKDTFAQMESDARNNISILKQMASQMANAENVANQLRTRDFSTVKSTEINNLDAFIEKIKGSKVPLDQMQNEITELQTKLNGATEASGMRDYLNSLDIAKAKFNSLNVSANNQATIQNKLTQETNKQISLESLKASKIANIDAYLAQQSKLTASNSKEAQVIVNKFTKLKAEIQACTDKTGLTALSRELSVLKNNVTEAGLAGESFGQKFKNALGGLSTWLSATTVIMSAIRSVKGALTELKEIDTYMTEISKTSDMTEEQLSKYASESFDIASKYGSNVQNFLSATQEMARSGFSGDTLRDLSELVILTETAGDVSRDSAEAYLLAMNAGFKYGGSVEKLSDALNSMNYLTNKNSFSMQDMADAMTKAGSVAGNFNVNIDEFSALVGSATSLTKKSGAEIGDSLKSIMINFQNIGSKKIRDTFDSIGISMTKLVDGAEELKTPIEIYKELVAVFNDESTSSIDKSKILTNIGGKYRANVLSALLSNNGFEQYEKMLAEYSQGENSAIEEANFCLYVMKIA